MWTTVGSAVKATGLSSLTNQVYEIWTVVKKLQIMKNSFPGYMITIIKDMVIAQSFERAYLKSLKGFCKHLRKKFVSKKGQLKRQIKDQSRPPMGIRVFHKWHFVKEKKCNTSTHPSWVYINQIWKNFFPKTSLEGLTTWSKMVKIDQNRRGGGMAVAWSFNSYQIVISSNTDCVSEL